MNFFEKTIRFLGTGGYVGHMPLMPGTFGSGLGVPLCFFLSLIPLGVSVMCALAFILVAVWVGQEAEKIFQKKDPGCIVIDEMAGMVVTLLGLPFNLTTVAAGFLMFRLFDIIKPPPIGWIQNKLDGGAGVVLDDVAAGIAANILLQLILLWTKQ